MVAVPGVCGFCGFSRAIRAGIGRAEAALEGFLGQDIH